MIARCLKCQKDFLQHAHERYCGCQSRGRMRKNHPEIPMEMFGTYMSYLRTAFQNPYKQWYKEFITTDVMPQSYFQLIPLTIEHGWH